MEDYRRKKIHRKSWNHTTPNEPTEPTSHTMRPESQESPLEYGIRQIVEWFLNSTPKRYSDFDKKKQQLYQFIIKNQNSYKQQHILYTEQIKTQVKLINHLKTYFKETSIPEIVRVITTLGYSASIDDYPLEHLDSNLLTIPEEYINLQQEAKELKKQSVNFMNIDYLLFPLALRKKHKQDKLEETAQQLTRHAKLVNNKMKADLNKLILISKSLQQIIHIMTTIKNEFQPYITELLDQIENDYQTLEHTPKDILMALHIYSKLLKQITEKKYIEEDSVTNLQDTYHNFANEIGQLTA